MTLPAKPCGDDADLPRNMRRVTRTRAPIAIIAFITPAFLAGCMLLQPAKPAAPTPEPTAATRPVTRTRAATAAVSAPPSASRASGALAPLPVDPPEIEPDAAASDSAGIARLLTLAQLWHTVSLHHPWVATRGVPWDSALIIAVTRVRAANPTDDKFRFAYQRLLSVLRDPLTRLEQHTADNVAPIAVEADRTTDSVLVMRIAPTAALNANDSAVVVQALNGVAPRVLLDLRGAPSRDPARFAERLDAFLVNTGTIDHLATVDVAAPLVRTRRIGTMPAAVATASWSSGSNASEFRDGWQSPADHIYRGHGSPRARIVILADSGSTLPLSLLALHDAARLSLIADGGLREAPPVPRVRLSLGSGIDAVVRAGDLVHADGTLDVYADTTIAPLTGSDAAQQYALTRLRSSAQLPLVDRPLPRFFLPAATPIFYDTSAYPYMGARLLAGFRMWSAMRARHAYRDLFDADIDAVLERVVPRLEAAKSATDYVLALSELSAATNDPAGALRGETVVAAQGTAAFPFRVRMAEGRAVLSDVVKDSLTTRLNLQNGTELISIEGYPPSGWIIEHARTVPSTNDWSRTAALLRQMALGPVGEVPLRVRDANNRERAISVPRRAAYRATLPARERPTTPASRTLSDGVEYVDVEQLTDSSVDAVLSSANGARGVVLDLRGTLNMDDTRLLRRLATRASAVVARVVQRTITQPCLVTLREATNDCADVRESMQLSRSIDTAAVIPARLVALIDERTSGAMERFALTLEQMSSVTFVGSASAGALTPSTTLALPGGVTMGIPTFELRRADVSQVQRVGLTPAVDVRVSFRGLRAGDDEVVTRAQQWLQQQLESARRRR